MGLTTFLLTSSGYIWLPLLPRGSLSPGHLRKPFELPPQECTNHGTRLRLQAAYRALVSRVVVAVLSLDSMMLWVISSLHYLIFLHTFPPECSVAAKGREISQLCSHIVPDLSVGNSSCGKPQTLSGWTRKSPLKFRSSRQNGDVGLFLSFAHVRMCRANFSAGLENTPSARD